MAFGLDLAQAGVAGLLGAIGMALATFLFNALRIPVVDLGRLIATKILRYHSHGTRLGLALHIINGVVLALIYAFLVKPLLPGPGWLSGLAYGMLLWLTMMLIVLPAMSDGFFGWRTSRQMIPSALFVHLLYGLIIGLGVSY
ncbi:MAG: hypothetical protein EXR58_06450 [Chloroflexi bacterium]|nr:hypothetical protein [Chloroflexota bacterium]